MYKGDSLGFFPFPTWWPAWADEIFTYGGIVTQLWILLGRFVLSYYRDRLGTFYIEVSISLRS